MAIQTFWKQFVAWVTGLRVKYQQDLFFRTECNVIFFQIVFAVLLLIFLSLAFDYLYQDLTQSLIGSIIQSLAQSQTISGKDILDSLHAIKVHNFSTVLVVTSFFTVFFGYIAARITLTPARNTLKSQKRFISDIAHELRTPLSIIKTNSEVTMFDPNLDTKIRNMLQSNIEELNRASEIINNLLTLNNLVQPEQIPFTDVDLGEIVDSVTKKLKKLAESKEVTISVRKKPGVFVWGNTTALEQVVINLVRNAINYTPSNGKVTVKVELGFSDDAILSVQDTGIGIAQKDLLHIFEPFYRAERSRHRQTGSSSGLGLTIVSELIKMHSGKITIKSIVNQGTTATVLLPRTSKKLSLGLYSTDSKDEISRDYSKK